MVSREPSREGQGDDLAGLLLQCPMGRNFLHDIERDEVDLVDALDPVQAFTRAARVARGLSPWSPRFDEALAVGRTRPARLVDLAREVAAHSATRWWGEPMDSSRQALFTANASSQAVARENPCDAGAEDARWESYAERPTAWRITSTVHREQTCLEAMITAGVGDWAQGVPYSKTEARIGESVRVFEIAGPADWHALCVAAPGVTEEGFTSPADIGTLVPDWRAVAADWDGVHLTFRALLTVPFVRLRSTAGLTMMWSWNTEGTIWLPGAPVS